MRWNLRDAINHVLFWLSYEHNSPLLTRKLVLLMNENERIGNPRIKMVKCVGALKIKTRVGSLRKRTLGLNFNTQNSQFLNWSLPTEKIFQVHG